jgi:hypothetical protein
LLFAVSESRGTSGKAGDGLPGITGGATMSNPKTRELELGPTQTDTTVVVPADAGDVPVPTGASLEKTTRRFVAAIRAYHRKWALLPRNCEAFTVTQPEMMSKAEQSIRIQARMWLADFEERGIGVKPDVGIVLAELRHHWIERNAPHYLLGDVAWPNHIDRLTDWANVLERVLLADASILTIDSLDDPVLCAWVALRIGRETRAHDTVAKKMREKNYMVVKLAGNCYCQRKDAMAMWPRLKSRLMEDELDDD